jgi:CheY-like chemotaxis protein
MKLNKIKMDKLLHKVRNRLSSVGCYLHAAKLHPKSDEDKSQFDDAIKAYKDINDIFDQMSHIYEETKEQAPNYSNIDKNFALVIDDNEPIRNEIKKLIEKNGLTVVSMTKAEDINPHTMPFDRVSLAVIDYQYDGSPMDGFDIIELLKQKLVKNIHMCTADYRDPLVIERINEYGDVGLLKKPFDEQEAMSVLFPHQ